MQPRGRRGWAPVLTGTAVTLSLTGVLLGRSLGPGYVLNRDYVTVPDPVLTARTWGLEGTAPRAVPLDAVTALLALVVPTAIQQQVMLVATLLLAGVGTAVLLRRRGVVAATVGAALATWSPYAAERLLLGQPPTLLAWSMLPWLVLAVGSGRPLRIRVGLVLLAALPAALTPYGGVLAAAVVLGTAWLVHGARTRELVALGGLAVIWCLPWLVPALGGRTDAGDADGAAAFSVPLRSPLDVLDVLGGGGVWAEGAALESRGQWIALSSSVAVLTLAVAGLGRVDGRPRVLLAFMAFAIPTVVVLLATPWGLAIWGWAQSVPGVALFRDTHRLLGPAWFALAVLAGLGAGRLARCARAVGGPIAGAGLLLAAVSLAPLSAPDAANRLHTAYVPVAFPESFGEVVRDVSGKGVLVLPWQPLRQVAWSGPQPFLDPLRLAVTGPVVSAHDLLVERDGRLLRVGSGDPAEAAAWVRGEVDPVALHRDGIGRVVVWKGTPGQTLATTAGLTLVLDTPEFEVWAVDA